MIHICFIVNICCTQKFLISGLNFYFILKLSLVNVINIIDLKYDYFLVIIMFELTNEQLIIDY